MKKRLLLFLLLCQLSMVCMAQLLGQAKIDSLTRALKNVKEDTNKVNILQGLAWEYRSINPDTSLFFVEQTITVAEKINDKKGIAGAIKTKGVLQMDQGNYPEALKYFFSSQKIFEELKNMPNPKLAEAGKAGIAKTLRNIGIVYWQQADNLQALDYYSQALKIEEELGNKNGIAAVLGNMGIIYWYQANYPKAVDYYLRALKLSEEVGDKSSVALTLSNLGNVYNEQSDFNKAMDYYLRAYKIAEELGNKSFMANWLVNIGIIHNEQSRYTKALEVYFKALNMADELGDKYLMGGVLVNIGNVYNEQANYSKAADYYFKALKIDEELGNKNEIAGVLNSIGGLYLQAPSLPPPPGYAKPETGYAVAEAYLKKSLALSEMLGNLENVKSSNQGLSVIDSIKGDFKSSLEHYKNYVVARDTIANNENIKKQTQSEMQYGFDKKEAIAIAAQDKKDALSKAEIRKQKIIRNAITGGLAILVLFSIVVYRQRNRISKEKKRSEELLLNILPEEIAEELKEKGEAEARLIDHVTVLFTDFKGFTQLSEKLTAKELVAEINSCFCAFDDIVQKHGVEKIKTIGDSYMCAGGLPVPNLTHAQDVVNVAFDIQQFMQQHKAERAAEGKLFFEIRIGIHSGPVVAGIVGLKKFSYDIWGDTVNTASRMESSGEVGKVNISGSTYELVKDKFTSSGSSSHLLQEEKGSRKKIVFVHRGKIQAKNKGEIDMYFVEKIL